MSDEFKKKLESYGKGQLEGEDLVAFENELANLDQYQEHLEEKDIRKDSVISERKQKKIIKKSKWAARIQTAFVAFAIFIIVMIVSSVLTAIYYSWGEPDRVDVLSDIIDYTLTVTEPYGEIGGTSSNAKSFFRMEMTRDLNKTVGKDTMKVGELNVNYLFSMMSLPEQNYMGKISQEEAAFTFPGTGDRGMSDWNTLANLPDGTVVSAYVSFNELMNTDEVFQQYSKKDLDISWFAVDTGVEETDEDFGGVIFDPIGFPNYPIWHDDDMNLDSREEQKGFLFGKIVSEGYSSPEYEEGNSDMLHTQFIKTLRFLEQHEKKVSRIYRGYRINLSDRLDYLETNGINHYGIVVTGPTREVEKLKEEKNISAIEVDEVGFWNWTTD